MKLPSGQTGAYMGPAPSGGQFNATLPADVRTFGIVVAAAAAAAVVVVVVTQPELGLGSIRRLI